MSRRPRTKTSDFNPKRFGANLKAIRRSRGLSQPELAEISDLSTQVISNLERATAVPSIDTVCKIARGIGIDPRELFSAGLTNEISTASEVSKLVALMETFDQSLAKEALIILQSLSRLRRR